MKIILLKKVLNLGNIGEKINVKPGYARNFLLPNNYALIANKENIKLCNFYKNKLEVDYDEKLKNLKNRLDEIKKIKYITIKAKSKSNGKLFGSIKIKDIISEIEKNKVKVFRNEIILNNNIKNTGKYEILIKLHKEIFTKIIIIVESS